MNSARLVWIDADSYRGFGCSECTWQFQFDQAPAPESPMMEYVGICFRAHHCEENPPRQEPEWPELQPAR